jgi:peptide/nickel transport system substrate-binding protein
MLLLAAGCAPTGPEVPVEPPGEAEPVEEEEPAEEEPTSAPPEEELVVEENIGRVAFYLDLVDFDPSNNFAGDNGLLAPIYETLTFYNAPGSEELISPRLATSWERNEDATEWTFYLREGVKFHDGTDFNAEAVKFSYERNSNPEMASFFIYDPIESVEIIDDYTIKFVNSYSAPLDIIFASLYGAYIISPTAFEGKDVGWSNEGNAVGTGPYMLESFDPATRIVYARFDDYWKGWEKEGQFTKLVYEFILDAPVREQLFRAGEVEITTDLSMDSIPDLMTLPDVTVDVGSAFFNLLVFFNHTRPLMENKELRQALAHTFPFEDAEKVLYGGLGKRASGWIPGGLWGHDPNMFIEYDLELAAELLEQAGYPDGGGLELVLWHYGRQGMKEIGELWMPELAKVGVTLTVNEMAYAAYHDILFDNPSEAGDIMIARWWPTYPTPYDWLFMLHHSVMQGSCCAYAYYSNPDFEALIDEANVVSGYDLDLAASMFIDAQKILMEDMPSFAVLDVPFPTYLRSDIKGYVYNPAYTNLIFWHDLTR